MANPWDNDPIVKPGAQPWDKDPIVKAAAPAKAPGIGASVQKFSDMPAKPTPNFGQRMGILGDVMAREVLPMVGKGAVKQLGRDAYGIATSIAAGPIGSVLGYLGKRTGITKKVERATAPSNTMERLGGAFTTAAEFLIPGPGEAGESETIGRLGKSLEESAEKQYGQVLNATTRGNKIRSAKVVPGMLKRGVRALSLKGLGEKTTAELAGATEKLEDAYAGLPADAAIQADGVLSGLMSRAKDAFEAGGKSMSPQSDKALELAKELGNRIMDQAVIDPATGNKVIPVDIARKTRQIWDEVSRAAGRFEGKDLADHSAGVVHGMAADSIREMLNQVAAGKETLGKLNQEYTFWRNADRVVQDTLLRKQGQARPLGQKIAQWVGFAKAGPLGYEAARAIEAATTSPAWRTTSAVAKYRLARAIASGNEAATTAIANGIAKGAVLEEARQ